MPLAGRPVLSRVIERIRLARNSGTVVVATTTSPKDDAVEELCRESGETFFRGSEADVLARFAGCARSHDADIVVRVTADCPLLSAAALDAAVDQLIGHDLDYVEVQKLPRGFPAEAIRGTALQRAHHEATDAHDREHVTPYLFRNPQKFAVEMPDAAPADRRPELRFTLDTPDDYRLIAAIYERLGDKVHQASANDFLAAVADDTQLLSAAHEGR